MDRRSLLLGLFGFASAVVTGAVVASRAEATPFDALRNLPAPEVDPPADRSYGEAPDGTPADNTYWVWRNGRRVWVAPRRRRRVCRRVWVRGRWRTRCWYR